jgi:uncharacterized repeat protein (TIGR01451 family)
MNAAMAAGIIALASLGALPQSASAATSGPQLAIAVSNGHTSTRAGDTLDYTITLRNLGTSPVSGLAVSQSVPSGLNFASANPVGKVHAGTVSWSVSLKAAGTYTLHTAMTVSATPSDLLRLATVACASTSPTAAPIVCASHSDQLPAGAAAAAHSQAIAARPAHVRSWLYGLAGGAGALVAAIAALYMVRRRRS